MYRVKLGRISALVFFFATSNVWGESLNDAVHLAGVERARISLSSERAVVQASNDSNQNTKFSIYKNRDDGWYLDQTITVDETGLFLGGAVGLDQGVLVTGFMDAPNYFEQNGVIYSDQPSSGAGYIFEADQNRQWENTQFVQVAETWRRMGRVVAISDKTIVLGGAPYYVDGADIDIYSLGTNSIWQLHTSIGEELLNLYWDYLDVGGVVKDYPGDEYIGSIMAVDSDTLVFRATPDVTGVEPPLVINENRYFNTSTKVYVREGNGWAFQATLTEGNEFSIDISEDTVLVGQVGAATFFVRDENGSWSEQDSITSTDGSFGYDVSIVGDYAVIASRTALYRFKRNENRKWQQLGSKITARDVNAVDLNGEQILVSATTDNGKQGAFVIPFSTENILTDPCEDTGSDGCELNNESSADDNALESLQSSGGGIASIQFLFLLTMIAGFRQLIKRDSPVWVAAC